MEYRRITGIIQKFLLFLLTLVVLSSGTSANTVMHAANNGQGSFQIDFIDVGQGDATLIQCDGHYMLVDGGESKQSSRIYSILKNRSIKYIDVMVATHPDADHIGGLSGALNYASVGVAYSPVTEHDTKTFQSFVKYLNKQGVSITVPQAGEVFSIGSATVTVLGPRTLSSETNNNSIVLRIVYGDTSFLLTGDAQTEEENSILSSGKTIQSTVLKVAHHGSKNSSGYRFIREVSPQYAVISVGSDNQYGHPTENVLSRLRDADVKTYRTDMQGDITCTSDGKTVSFSVNKNKDADTLAGAGLGQKSNTQTQDNYSGSSNLAETTIITDTGASGSSEANQTVTTYVLNTNTHKFHYPSCSSVSQMKEKNKSIYTGSREDVVAQGYVPCKRCNP